MPNSPVVLAFPAPSESPLVVLAFPPVEGPVRLQRFEADPYLGCRQCPQCNATQARDGSWYCLSPAEPVSARLSTLGR